MSTAVWKVGDVFERMAEIPDGSVDVVITSPPFLNLRSYLPSDHPHKGKEIGSEPTPAAFLSTMMALTREWRRILAPHGSIAVELGDTYSGSGGAGGDYGPDGIRANQPKFRQVGSREHRPEREGTGADGGDRVVPVSGGAGWPLAKSLCGIPTLYPWSLAYGHNLLNPDDRIEPWRIRNLIAWVRPNPPVGALGDKVRPATSYITVACTSAKRWFDLDAERVPVRDTYTAHQVTSNGYRGDPNEGGDRTPTVSHPAGAPLLDWWNIPPGGYSGAHYAVYPPELPRRLINLMCPRQVCVTCGEPRRRIVESEQFVLQGAHARTHKADPSKGRLVPRKDLPLLASTGRTSLGANAKRSEGAADAQDFITKRTTLGWSDCGHDTWRNGIVLDPFGGSGTTAMVASGLGRDSISIDLDPRNADFAYERVGMFLEVTP